MGISALRIKELFEDRLSLRLKAGEAGMGRVVEKLAVMETEDFYLGAEPRGMFVLTTLSFVQKDGAGMEAVIGLIRAGVSVLGVKINRYFNEIPRDIVDVADQYGIPLFEIGSDIHFSNVIRLITEEIVMESAGGKDETASRHAQLLRKYMNDEPLEAILGSLGEMIGASCFFIDVQSRILASYQFPQRASNRNISLLGNKLLKKSLNYGRKKHCFYDEKDAVFLCQAGETLLGVLVIMDQGQLPRECEEVVWQALSYIVVRVCEQRITERQSAMDQGSGLLDQVLFQQQREGAVIRNHLKNGGFELLDRYAFIVVARRETGGGEVSSAPMEYCGAQLRNCFERCIIKWDSHGIKCLITFPKDSSMAQSGVLADRMIAFRNQYLSSDEHFFDIGLSLVQDDPCEITRSFLQAQAAIEHGRIYRPEKHIYDYAAFLVQGLLHQAQGTQEYNWLCQNVVEPISERDRLYESGLWETLDVLFRVRSLKVAANDLHIHISTLRYRLQKVKDVTGLDFLTAYGNYVLHTAYLIWMENNIRYGSE